MSGRKWNQPNFEYHFRIAPGLEFERLFILTVISVSYTHLDVYKRQILTDVSLAVLAGEFVSLVGGSGAGKSTLLRAMNGFNPATHGQMLIDGEQLYPNLDAYRMIMGLSLIHI